jgi:hypothetical protein
MEVMRITDIHEVRGSIPLISTKSLDKLEEQSSLGSIQDRFRGGFRCHTPPKRSNGSFNETGSNDVETISFRTSGVSGAATLMNCSWTM